MRTLAFLAVVLVVASCSTTATIVKNDGTIVEGEILFGDKDGIHVNQYGFILRSDIKYIDHPGNIAVLIGISTTLLTGVGGVFLGFSVGHGSGGEDAAIGVWIISGLLSSVSIGYSIWGTTTWYTSSSMANLQEEHTGPKISPVVLSESEKTYWGLGMSWRW